jgi:hypothetical protein
MTRCRVVGWRLNGPEAVAADHRSGISPNPEGEAYLVVKPEDTAPPAVIVSAC